MNISRNIFMMCYFLLKRLRVTLRAGQKSTKISRKISSAKELAAEEDKGKLGKTEQGSCQNHSEGLFLTQESAMQMVNEIHQLLNML